jgi:hypothetical protein
MVVWKRCGFGAELLQDSPTRLTVYLIDCRCLFGRPFQHRCCGTKLLEF